MLPIIQFILPFLAKYIPDPTQLAKAQSDLTTAMIANNKSLVEGMAEVMKADSQSESWLTRTMRPITVAWSLFMVTFVGIIAPAIGIQAEVVQGLKGVPEDLWGLVQIGIGAWILGRSAEKILAKK